MPPLILPARYASLADAAAADSTRYAMTGVMVNVKGDTVKLTATDSKMMVRVVTNFGPDRSDWQAFPSTPALDAAPNSALSALIPTDHWRGMKANRARRAAIILGDAVTTIGTIGAVASPPKPGAKPPAVAVSQAPNVEGRFPPADDIIQKSEPLARFALPISCLRRLLKSMDGLLSEDNIRLTFEVRDAEKPIQITARDNERDANITGLIMPMSLTDVHNGGQDDENRRRIGPARELCRRHGVDVAQALPPAPVAAQADQGDTVTVDREEYERMLRMARQAGYTPPAD